MRLRANFTSGTIDNDPLSATDTILTSDTIDLPDLDAGGYDYYALILDPSEVYGDLEVVYVIEHDKGGATPSDTATLVRGKEGTLPRSHVQGTQFTHGPTKMDMIQPRIEYPIDFPKHTIDTPDDNFDGDTLDAKWTVEDGASGSIDLLEEGSSKNVYEINDGRFDQSYGNNYQTMYQSYTLPIDNSLVAKIYPNTNTDGSGGPDDGRIYFGLQDNNTAHRTNNYAELNLYVSAEDTILRVYANGSEYADGAWSSGSAWYPGAPFYGKITRTDTTEYQFQHSFDGEVWTSFRTIDLAATMTYIYLRTGNLENVSTVPIPIMKWDWIRQGGNGVKPW